ncbi:unnamed protein product, partial [Rotaria sp. Silwood2]
IEKLYLQEYDMTTLKPTNYDINVDFMWAIFDVPEKLFVLQDLHQFHLLKTEPQLCPQKSLTSSPRKRSLATTDTEPPTKVSHPTLESPSTGMFSLVSNRQSFRIEKIKLF